MPLQLLLNRLGHSISYDEVVKLEKSFVEQTLSDQGDNNLAIPTNISPGTFVQAAACNLDFNEQTLDGKNTTHVTTLVLYQQTDNGNFGAEVKTKFEKKLQPKSKLKLSLEVMNFSKQCRKLKQPNSILLGTNPHEPHCPSKSIAKCLDMAWVFARACPSKDFQVSLEKNETQMVPAWSAFNAYIASTSAPLTSIGSVIAYRIQQ